jgi:hypothetical protein
VSAALRVVRATADREAESDLLGHVVARPALLSEIAGRVTPEAMGDPGHRELYAAMLRMRDAGVPITHASCVDAVADAGGDPSVVERVLRDARGTPGTHVVRDLADRVAGHAIRRDALVRIGTAYADLAAGRSDVDTVLAPLRAIAPARDPIADRMTTVTADWLVAAPPEPRYLIRDSRTGLGALIARGTAILGGAGGAGKGHVTMGLALAISTGTPWLGVMVPEAPGRVLIVSAEEPAEELHRRIHHTARALRIATIPTGSIDIVDVHDAHTPLLCPDGTPTGHARAITDLVRRHGPYALVIIDPVARLAGASIDADNSAASALITAMEAIATAADGLVLGVHHTSQASRQGGARDATALRGATALGDGARAVMLLTSEAVTHDDPAITDRIGEIVSLTAAKANHVRRWAPIRMRRADHGVLVPLDAADEAMIADAVPVSRARASARPPRPSKSDAIRDAIMAVLADAPDGLSYRDLRTAVRPRVGGVSDATLVPAIDAMGDDITRTSGARGATIYRLGGDR